MLNFLVFAYGIFNRCCSFYVMAYDLVMTYKRYAVNCCPHFQSSKVSQIAENCSCYLFSYCPPSPFFLTILCTFRFSYSKVFCIMYLFYLPAVGLFTVCSFAVSLPFYSSKISSSGCTRAVRKVSRHFEYLENQWRGLDIT